MAEKKTGLGEQHRQARKAALAGNECAECGGVECDTLRVPVCCGDCTH